MSRRQCPKSEENVAAFLLSSLHKEETNVATLEREVTKRLANFEDHERRLLALRKALEALGVDPDNGQVRRNYE
jgi:hypothetical protein